MAACDLCGKDDTLVYASIEGTQLNVCKSCAAYGKVIQRARPAAAPLRRTAPKVPEKETIQSIREDYHSIIKNKREELGLKQKELAVKLAERESLIQKIDTEQYVPSIEMAR